MKSYLIASAAALAVAVPAGAQVYDAPAFGGPRIELRGGYDRGNVEVTYSDEDGETRVSDGANGISYGGEIGYDLDTGGTVLGAYAGLDFADTRSCSELFGLDRACLKTGRNITLGGRIGVPMGVWGMLYAKGGYSNGQVKASYEDFENILPDESQSRSVDGFHVGGGVEAALASRVYGKIEYVYTNYGRFGGDDTAAGGISSDRHQVLAGAGLRF